MERTVANDIGIKILIILIVVFLFTVKSVYADVNGDYGNVAVLQYNNSDLSTYNNVTSEGQPNYSVREWVSRQFYATHGDYYDFIIVFTNFDFTMFDSNMKLDASGEHFGVKNFVQGIGSPIFDNTSLFGSYGKLQGYIDLGNVSSKLLKSDPNSYNSTMMILAHEIEHQWAAYVHFIDNNGNNSNALLGVDQAHWSYLLDSDASVLYGSKWIPIGNGQYQATDIEERYSPLDLYLMGLNAPSEVPPMTLLVNPAIAPAQLPQVNAVITATPITVTINQIIQAEGARFPDYLNSQKSFRAAFVLLLAPGTSPSLDMINAINIFRQQWEREFFILTNGRGVMDTHLVGSNPGPFAAPPNVINGINWLTAHQLQDGSWADSSYTTIRDTVESILALRNFTSAAQNVANGLNWLSASTPTSTDELAQKVDMLSIAGVTPVDWALNLSYLQNSDGGWGPAYGYNSNPMDTALILNAINAAGTYTPGTVNNALTWLTRVQDRDGGWGNTDSGSSRIMTTVNALNVLSKFNNPTFSNTITNGINWLLHNQKPNGSFGDDGGSIYETAQTLLFLISLNDDIYNQYITRATNYLLANQLVDYSWNDSTYQTALAIQAIAQSNLPQLYMGPGDLILSDSNPYSGETVHIAGTVHNTGKAAATNVVVRFYNGNPYNGGIQIGSDQTIPVIQAGGMQTITIDWDTTGFTGSTIIYAIADPDNTVPEMDTSQKQALTNVNVQPRPVEAQLIVTTNDISFNPSYLFYLPSNVVISANISNIGMADAGDVEVSFYDGNPQNGGILISTTTLSVIPAMGVAQATAAVTITTPGIHNIYVWVDPNQLIPQPSRIYNIAYKPLPFSSTIDLEISSSDITFFKNPVNIGEHLTVSALVHNNGTQMAQNVLVAFYATAGNGISIPIGSDIIPFIYGNSAYYANIDWLTELSGNPVTITVVVDPNYTIQDYNRANNTAQANVTILPSQLPNLLIVADSFTISDTSPKEGELLTISGIVENNGFTTATNIEVDIYVDSSADSFTINTITIPSLNPGQTQLVSAQWIPAGFRGKHVISMVIDPYNQIQEFTKEDNKADMPIYILSYPDLAIGSGDISFIPNYPPSGASVNAIVNVHNLGEQGASNVAVNLSEGTTRLGTTIIPYVAGLSSTVATIAFTAGTEGSHTLTVNVDPYNAIAELSKDNNQASATLIVQNSNLSVDNLYFSPNGDGIKDTVTLTYRQPSGYSGNAIVSIVNELGETVRTFTNTTGSVVWNGLNDQGLLVPDGTYQMVLTSSDGSSTFGSTNVVLDTNRYPLMKAVGTKYLKETDLTCNGYDYYILPSDVDNGYITYGDTNRLVFINPDGSFIYLTPQNWQNVSIQEAVISPDGQKIAFVTRTNIWTTTVYVVNNDGSNLRIILPESTDEFYGYLNWSPDSTSILVDEEHGCCQTYVNNLWLINVNTGEKRIVNSTSNGFMNAQWSNDGKFLFINYDEAYLGNFDTYDLYIANGDGTNIRLREQGMCTAYGPCLISPSGYNVYYENWYGQWLVNPVIGSQPVLLPGGPSGCQWSPDGTTLACIGGAKTYTPQLIFYDASGKISTSYGLGQLYSFSSTTSALGYGANINIISWLGDGTGVVIDVCVGPLIWNIETTSVQCNIQLDKSLPPDYSYIGVIKPSGELTKITPLSMDGLTSAGNFALSPDNRSITFDQFYQSINVSGIGVLDLPTGMVSPVLIPRNPNNIISQGNHHGSLGWSKSGRVLNYWDNIYSTDPTSPCYKGQYSSDYWAMTSLYNLTNEFTVIKQKNASAVTITGTVSDINFDHYTLEYALNTTSTTWMPIVAAGNTSIVDGYIATWIPPDKGQYIIRLTAYDKAGNKQTQIRYLSWSEAARLTNLAVQPQYISPNGDGVQDYATVSYAVIEPGHFDFKIYSPEGQWINTIAKDYTEPTTDSFTWYGTDFNGSVVPDGQYTIEVDNIKIFVTVDDTPPLVSLNYLSGDNAHTLYGPIYDGTLGATINIESSYNDSNINTWTLPVSGLTFCPGGGCMIGGSMVCSGAPCYEFEQISTQGNPEFKIFSKTTMMNIIGHNITVSATDLAGNSSTATLPQIPSGIFWMFMGYRSNNVDIGELLTGNSVLRLGKGIYRFSIGDAITDYAVSATLEYRESGSTSWINTEAVPSEEVNCIISFIWDTSGLLEGKIYELRVVALDRKGNEYQTPIITIRLTPTITLIDGGIWVNHSVFLAGRTSLLSLSSGEIQYLPLDETGISQTWQTITGTTVELSADGIFIASILGQNPLKGCNYTWRVMFVDDYGNTYYSNALNFSICNQILISGGIANEHELMPGGESYLTSPVISGTYTISNAFSSPIKALPIPAFLSPIKTLPIPEAELNKLNNIIQSGIGQKFGLNLPIDCTQLPINEPLFVNLEFTDINGNIFSTSHKYKDIFDDNGSVMAKIVVILSSLSYLSDTNISPIPAKDDYLTEVFLLTSCRNRIMELSAAPVTPSTICNELPLPYYRLSAVVGSTITISSISFSYTTNLNFPWLPITATTDLSYTWLPATLTRPQGDYYYVGVYNWDTSQLPRQDYYVLATATDINGYIYTATTIVDEVPPLVQITSPVKNEFICPSLPVVLSDGTKHYYQPINGEISDIFINDYGIAFSDAKISGWQDIGKENYSEYKKNVPSYAPLIKGQLGKWDITQLSSGAYGLRLTATDNGGNLSCYDVPVYLSQVPKVSINNAYPQIFSPNGDGNLDTTDINIAVEAINDNTLYVKTPSGNTVKTISVGTFTQTGIYSIQWNGTDDTGAVVPDGDYILDLVSTSPCLTSNDAQAKVTIDNTPPIAIMTYPYTTADNLPLMVNIIGTASDLHFSKYTLEYISNSAQSVWNTITTSSVPITSGTLGLWNTYGLTGEYTLRLSAYDLAGNASTATVTVTIPPRGNLIEALYVTPTIFSPNKDGMEDTANINCGLAPGCDAGCSITLSIVDIGKNKIKTLTNATSVRSGSYNIIWDGSIDSGVTANDGDYLIMLVAVNDVTSQTETVPVTIDDTAPAINITSPLNGNYLTTPTLSVVGSITDLHLSGYNITYTSTAGGTVTIDTGTQSRDNYLFGILSNLADGVYGINISATDLAGNISNTVITFTIDTTPPIVKIQSPAVNGIFGGVNAAIPITAIVSDINLAQYSIRTGEGDTQSTIFLSTLSPTTQPLYIWDVSNITDGTYNIMLSAVDKAGNSASDTTSVIIDNTPPVTLITIPQTNAIIGGPVDVIGTASDTNLVMYELDISSGIGNDAYKWATIISGTASITDSTIANLNTIYPNGYYTLRLFAMDIANNISEYDVPIKYEIAPPEPPTDLTASAKLSDVTLEWLPSPSMFVAGYNVYRSGVQINTTPVTDTTYVDLGLPDGAYTYTVTAINEAGAESGPSNLASISVDTTPPFTELINPHNGQYVAGTVSIVGIAYSALDFSSYTLEIGEGISPSSWNILVNSPVAVNYGTLADWDTSSYNQGIPYTIQLTASDIHGNARGVSITVIVDNTAPSGPLNLTASTYVSDVTLNWNASNDADIAGYILYRNDQIANALGQPGTNLTPYLITTTSYIDKSLPNGTYTYYVIAMDYAGNMSLPSNTVTVNIEARPPIMWISQPITGTVITGPTTIIGISPDLNIAFAQFEYRQSGTASWQMLGSAVTTQPFQTLFDPYALSLIYGHYDLIAVATDTYNLTDPNPQITTIGYVRPPTGLVTSVNQSLVNLSWNTDNNAGVLGYNIYRMTDNNPSILITASPVSGNTYQDDTPDTAIYTYTITTIDTAGDESVGSAAATAKIYFPVLTPLVWITTTVPLNISGNNAASNSAVTIYRLTSAGLITEATMNADTNGNFTGAISLSGTGRIALQANAQDSLGNISLPSNIVSTIYSIIPPIPQGLGITNTDSVVSLTWLPVVDKDLLGYNVYKDNIKINSDIDIAQTGTVSASTSSWEASYAIDGDYTTSWLGYCRYGFSPQWFAESFSTTSLINGLTIVWATYYDWDTGIIIPLGGTDFTVQAWNGYDWVNITTTTGNTQTTSNIRFPYGVLTSGIRLYVNSTQDPYSWRTGITELKVFAETPVTQTTYIDPHVSNGLHVYTVTSENIYGLESPQSQGASVTPFVAPPSSPIDLTAVVNIKDIGLSWTTTDTITNVTYNLYRSYNNSAFIKLVTGLTQTSYDDRGLANGSYSYTVTSVDIAGNESTPSNTATAIVNIVPTTPSFYYPGNSGDTITLTSNVTDIYGNADPMVMVEVYQNNTYIGSVLSDQSGGFYLYSILLAVGANTFTAVAVDSTGVTSGVSIPLTIDFDTTGLPDISVNGISIYPVVPLAGDQVGVSVSVSNIGTGDASNIELVLTVQSPDGTTSTVLDTTIPSLPAGQGRIVGGLWNTSITNTGYNLITAIADPHNQIIEVSKNNNVFYQNVFVTSNANPVIQVSTDKSSYTANDMVMAYVNVTNAGATANVPVIVDIEDGSGNVVTTLLNTVLNNLAYGQTKTFTLTWNTGATLAGNYNLHGWITGANNTIINESKSPFTIIQPISVSSSVISNKLSYNPNEDVILTIKVTNNTTNTILSDLTATAIITSPCGSVVTTGVFTVPQLMPQDSTSLSMLWNTGLNIPGGYSAVVNIWKNGNILSSASAIFNITSVTRLAGTLTLQPNTVGENSPYTINYSLVNTGNVDLAATLITITIINPLNSNILATLYDIASVNAGLSYSNSLPTTTAGFTPATYTVILSATVNNIEKPLATAMLTVKDIIPPVITLVSPLDGSYFSTPVPITVTASDDSSGVSSVLYSLDNGNFGSLPLINGNNLFGTYSYTWSIVQPDEGIHNIQFKAIDFAGNISPVISSTFTVDVTPPLITITGVADNTVYHTPVTPVITVQDTNLAGLTVLLNGAPFTSGTTITPQGSYTLDVKAYDKAGNSSELTEIFKIVYDTTPPVTTIAIGPPVYTGTTMLYVSSNSLFSLNATDNTAVKQTQYEIDNTGWITYILPWTITDDGLHTIGYMSTDIFGNVEAAHYLSVTVDNTPPITSITQNTIPPTSASNGVFPYTLFALYATDTISGVFQSQWAVDGGSWHIYTTPFSLSQYQPGTHIISYRSVDNLGNTEAAHITTVTLMKIDVSKGVKVNALKNILVYSQCRSGRDDKGSDNEGDKEGDGSNSTHKCSSIQSDRRAYIASLFSGTDIAYDFTTTAKGFIESLRSDKYSEYLIFTDNGNLFDHACNNNDDNDNNKCGDTTRCYPCNDKEISSELKEAVNSGAGLILIKYYPSNLPFLSDVLGVKFKGNLRSTNKLFVNMVNSGVFQTGTAALRSDAHVAVKITLTTGNMAAYFTGQSGRDGECNCKETDNSEIKILDLGKGVQPECEGGRRGETHISPAIVTNTYGKGMSVLFAYDPLEAASYKDDLLLKQAILEAVNYAVPITNSAVSSGVVGVSTTVSVYGSNVSLKLEEHIPSQTKIMSISNGGIITGTTITWLVDLANNASTIISEELMGLPGAGSLWTITTLVNYLSLQGYLPYSSYSLTFTAPTISVPLTMDTLSALQSLTVTSAEDRKHLERAIKLYKQAVSGSCKNNDSGDGESGDDSRGQTITTSTICATECSVNELLNAINEISEIKGADTTGIRFDLDLILRSYEQKWYGVKSPS